jgi:hypothetical protein
MKKILGSVLIGVCLLWVSVYAQDASVAEFATVSFSGGTEVLPPGVLVRRGGSSSSNFIQFQSIKGWTSSTLLTPPENWKITQASSVVLCPRIFVDTAPIALWVYKKSLWWYNLEQRRIVRKDDFDSISDIIGFYKDRYLLFAYTYRNPENTKSSSFLDVWVYDTQTRRKARIGFFDNNRLSFEDFVVSPDYRYALITVGTPKQSVVHFYNLQQFSWDGWATNVYRPRWLSDGRIIFYNREGLWVSDSTRWINAKGQVEGELRALPQEVKKILSYRVEGNDIFLLAENRRVYQGKVGTNSWFLTDYKSLEWSSDKRLDFYVDNNGGHLYDVLQKKLYPQFSGENPQMEFIAFTLDGILVQQSFAKILTLFLLDSSLKELYRYKAIDKIHAMSGDGVLMEVVEEGDELFLIVEQPQKGYYFIFPAKL